MLVTLQFLPLIVAFFLKMFCMFHKPLVILLLYIVSLLIMMFSLNIIPPFFLSRIGPRGEPFCTGHVKMGFTPFLLWTPRLTKQCLNVTKPSMEQWHSLLGHPSFKIVSHVVRDRELSSISNKNITHVCDACQQGKSHQLPFPKSVSISKAPLELIFSDVCALPLLLLACIIIICLSSMILASSPGFIYCNISLRCSKNSMIFKPMLRDFLIVRC
jgi:hypothetical protein